MIELLVFLCIAIMELGYRFLANDTLGMFVMTAVLNVDGQKVVAAVVVVVVVVIVGLLGILWRDRDLMATIFKMF